MGKKSKRRANKAVVGVGVRGAADVVSAPTALQQGDLLFRPPPPNIDLSRNTYGGLPESHTDDVGRMFCSHNKEYCHICCVDHRMCNRIMEENAGLRKKPTPLEEAAKMYATSLRALRGMERMYPRPSEEVFEQNRQWKNDYEEKLRRFAEAGEDVQSAVKRAIDLEGSDEIEREAMMQNMARLNPGQTEFELGGTESQEIYDKFIKGPQGKASRADFYTCSYCGKTSTKKLRGCGRCQKPSYCNSECQRAAWPAHKKECEVSDKKPKSQSLTWDQVEAHQGGPAKGILEVKAIKDESMMRQVFQCKDRIGMCRRIAAYTDSRQIPGLKVGATVKWRNPRFHYFMDGSSGARIEEADLEDVKVT